MTIYKHFIFAVILSQGLLLGCSQRNEYSAALPKEVNETSGLACLKNDSFLTINDSGNPSTLWEIDSYGRISRQFDTKQPNKDWEAITTNQTAFFVADTGNNSGRRNGGQIYQYQINDLPTTKATAVINYQFAEFPNTALLPYRHDFDIEAVAYNDNKLVMFSKSWTGGPSNVYQLLTTTEQLQLIKPIAQIQDLPGVITDATWSDKHKVYVLTGYANFQQSLISVLLSGNWSPFLAVVSADFKLISVKSIPDAGQLEAVCLDSQDFIWLSQEQYKKSPAKLWRFGTLDALLN